jgi:hypothetical protein
MREERMTRMIQGATAYNNKSTYGSQHQHRASHGMNLATGIQIH